VVGPPGFHVCARTAENGSYGRCVPVTIGQLFPTDDPVGHWVFKLAALLDDLALVDTLMREDWETEPNHSVSFFRMITTRLYEARRIVRDMNEKVAVVRFINDVPNVAEPRAFLIDAYLRPDPDTKSRVEDAYATARHLTVHYTNKPGELARMLRTARDVEARIFSDDESALVYLWPQDVMERVLWPPETREADLEFAHELTQAFTRLFVRVIAAYFERRGVEKDDIVWVSPEG
jgi:hypothetical protein